MAAKEKVLQLVIDGKKINVRKFATKTAAENFKKSRIGRTLVYFRAHEYFVSI